MPNVKLLVNHGILYFPTGSWQNENNPSLLLRVYSAGDCDSCPWPMFDSDRKNLAYALYDERETNPTFTNHAIIELPDGEIFDFDSLVD